MVLGGGQAIIDGGKHPSDGEFGGLTRFVMHE